MQSFLGLEVELLEGCIKLHLDTYIQELIAEYQLIRPKFLKPKKVPMSPGVVLDGTDCPDAGSGETEAIPLDGGQGAVRSILDSL